MCACGNPGKCLFKYVPVQLKTLRVCVGLNKQLISAFLCCIKVHFQATSGPVCQLIFMSLSYPCARHY